MRSLVMSAPLTPNGRLHLGHLSGPYLGADIYARYLRLRGVDAAFSTWTDDYQSYVVARGAELGEEPAAVARRFGDAFVSSLGAAEVDLALCLRPQQSKRYAEAVLEMTRQLYAAGHLVVEEVPCHYSEQLGRYLFEADVGGRCPVCEAPAGTGICEECGHPNSGVDLLEPRCYATGERPSTRALERLVFPLAPHADVLREELDAARMSPRLRVLCESLLERGLPDVPASRLGEWGTAVEEPRLPGQVFVSWYEMGAIYLLTGRKTAELRDWPAPETPFPQRSDVEVTQFFGADNAFYQAVLYPAMYRALWPESRPPRQFVVNEFYRLEKEKFSTSRNHAVWVEEIAAEWPSDVVRFFLSHTRPETEQTHFSRPDLAALVRRELVDGWEGWLGDLGRRLRGHFNGRAPAPPESPECWSAGARDFRCDLAGLIGRVGNAYDADRFSPRRVTRTLGELVVLAREHAARERHWSEHEAFADEWRAAVALELAAARSLALLASPIMPSFGADLWRGLGQVGSPVENGWEEDPGWVAEGTRIELVPGRWTAALERVCGQEPVEVPQ